jgi:hypothetical protein
VAQNLASNSLKKQIVSYSSQAQHQMKKADQQEETPIEKHNI